MRRKVILLAGKTLVVSLPSKWAKENNVKKGDEVEITEAEKQLTIHTEKELETKKVTIDDAYDPLYVAYLYQAGVDEIRVNYKDRAVFQKMQEKIADLMGFEIVDQGERHAEIKNVSSALEEEFDTILRRTFYILEDMGKSSLEAIQSKNFDRLKDLLELEKSVNKFTDFCKRVLTKKGHKNSGKTQFFYAIIRDLEKIGDFYADICKHVSEAKTTLDKETVTFYKETNEFLHQFHKLFYKFSEEEAEKFQERKKSLKIKSSNMIKNTKKEDLYVVYNLTGLVKMTGNLYGPYYTTTI